MSEMKQLYLIPLLLCFSFSVLSQMDSVRLRTIEEKYGEQWDFCTCVVKNDSINKAFMRDDLSEEEFNNLFTRSEQIEQKCRAFLASYQLSTPDARALHEKRIHDCLQNELEKTTGNRIHIEFTDVVTKAPISELTFILTNSVDTTVYADIPGGVLDLNLETVGNYTATAIKEGYDTLWLEFENPQDSADQILEFFIPRTDLTKDEMKMAHKNSLQLPERVDESSGGFQQIRASRKEFIVLRYRAFLDGSSTKIVEFRKVRKEKH